MICPLCEKKLKFVGSIRIGPRGGQRRVYVCTDPKCPCYGFRLLMADGGKKKSVLGGALKGEKAYTGGEVNRIIDGVFHPLYDKNQLLRLVDGLAHGVVEGDAKLSAKKFLRYNLPEILRKILDGIE